MILSNGDNPAVSFQCELSRYFLKGKFYGDDEDDDDNDDDDDDDDDDDNNNNNDDDGYDDDLDLIYLYIYILPHQSNLIYFFSLRYSWH